MKVYCVSLAEVSSQYQFIGLLGSFQYEAVHLTTHSLKSKKKNRSITVFHCISMLPVINMTSYIFLKQWILKHFIWTFSAITAVLARALLVCFCVRLFFFFISMFSFDLSNCTQPPVLVALFIPYDPLLTASQCNSHIEDNIFSVVVHTVVYCFPLYLSVISICTSVSLCRIPLVCLSK
jgi:hypothetical protein